MKEYTADSAKNYKQSSGKQILLLPSVDKQLEQVAEGKLLDVGCGTGDLFPLVKNKGYEYFGLDLTKDMLAQAQKRYPQGHFQKADATDFAHLYQDKFDVVVSLMMFPCFEDKKMITRSLSEMKKVTKNEGKIMLGLAHPSFDPYMQKYLFDRQDTETDFKGYFSSGNQYIIHKRFDEGTVSFEDHHWLMSDYVESVNEAGLKLLHLDECEPDTSKKIEWDSTFTKQRLLIPTYMLLVCSK